MLSIVMRQAEARSSVYVVYPAALLDGWEVVKEHDDKPVSFRTRAEATAYARSQAIMDGGALIKLEDWYGNTESIWEAGKPVDALGVVIQVRPI